MSRPTSRSVSTDRALGNLGVAAEHPDVIRQSVEVLACHREAHRNREALPERTGRYVNPRKDRRGMTLKAETSLTEGKKLRIRDDAPALNIA